LRHSARGRRAEQVNRRHDPIDSSRSLVARIHEEAHQERVVELTTDEHVPTLPPLGREAEGS